MPLPRCPSCGADWWDPDERRPLVFLEAREDGLAVECRWCGEECVVGVRTGE